MKHIILIGILFFTITASASDFDDALYNYEQENYQKAFKAFERLSDEGNASATLMLAKAYHYGNGVDENIDKAIMLYESLAIQGNSTAQFELGKMYSSNNGKVKKDLDKSLMWLLRFSESKSGGVRGVDFLLSIGSLIMNSSNGKAEGDAGFRSEVIDDDKFTFNWMKAKAKQGSNEAKYLIAMMYASGRGVEENKEKAFEIIKKLSENNNMFVQYKLGEMYYSGDGTRADKQESFKWMKKSATRGFDKAQYSLAFLYEVGEGTSQNTTEALKWYKESALNGNKKAKKLVDLIGKYNIKREWSTVDGISHTLTNHLTSNFKTVELVTLISFSKGNIKKIYFTMISNNKNMCDPQDYENESNSSTSIWTVNRQAIKMLNVCEKSGDKYYIQVTAYSDKGSTYIINLLKKSSKNISVSGEGYEFPVSTKGFSKEWGKTSDNVL